MRVSLLVLAIATALAVGHAPNARAADVIVDRPFPQEAHQSYPLASAPERDVRAVTVDHSGVVWCATAAGVRYLDRARWQTPPGGDMGPAWCLIPRPSGGVLAGAWDGVYTLSRDHPAVRELPGTPVGALGTAQVHGHAVVAAGGVAGIWLRSHGGRWRALRGHWNRGIAGLLPRPDGTLWIATVSGLDLYDPGTASTRQFSRPSQLLSGTLSAIAGDGSGRTYITSTAGVDVYRGIQRVKALGLASGLPYRACTSVAFDRRNRLLVGTKIGLARYNGAHWSFRNSRRWLSSDEVRSVAVGADGTVWVGTAAGVDAITTHYVTLAEKAAVFEHNLHARHIRAPGLVGPAVLYNQGDLTRSWMIDDDNDGEHTGEYCAAESFRYAVTHDPVARENARRAFHALVALQRVTGTHHFIARSMLPKGVAPKNEVNHHIDPRTAAEIGRLDPREKMIDERWVPSPDGNWLWKRDASSDEVDGHLFGYSTYYDLAATRAERAAVSDEVDRVVGGIVDHGFTLQDIDGKPTRWGNWSPESLNGDPTWHEERAGNSVEILSHLQVALYTTGKRRYAAAMTELIRRHGYLRNAQATTFDTPSEHTEIEDELLSIVYPVLMTHALSPELRRAYRVSMLRWHRVCLKDGDPLYDFAYNRFSGDRVPLSAAAATLRTWPLDMIEWTVDNSQREDVRSDRTPGIDPGHLDRVLPRDEMGLVDWDQDPYRAVIGRDGMWEDKNSDWLLAYWMGRYYGFITAPRR